MLGAKGKNWMPDLKRDRGRGFGSRIGTAFINRKLEPIYRRAGRVLSYAYALEVNRGPWDTIDGETLHGRGGYGLVHATILLSIPDELFEPVTRAISRHFKTPREWLTRRNSGSPAHLTRISAAKGFVKGGGATLHVGVLGVMDYVAKGFRVVHDLRAFYDREARTGYNPIGSKPIGADTESWARAEAIYNELWRWWRDEAPPTRVAQPSGEDEQVCERILAAEGLRRSRVKRPAQAGSRVRARGNSVNRQRSPASPPVALHGGGTGCHVPVAEDGGAQAWSKHGRPAPIACGRSMGKSGRACIPIPLFAHVRLVVFASGTTTSTTSRRACRPACSSCCRGG